MNILLNLILEFSNTEKYKIILIIILSLFLNILKITILSYIIAKIIKSVEIRNINNIFQYYHYFIFVSILFIIIFYFYKKIQSSVAIKLRFWMKHELTKKLFYANNEDYLNLNYNEMQTPIFRVSSNIYYLFIQFINQIIPNFSIISIIFLYFLFNNFIFGLIFIVGNIIIISYIIYFYKEIIETNKKFEFGLMNNEKINVDLLHNFDKIIYRGQVLNELNKFWKHSEDTINLGNSYYQMGIKHSLIINILIFLFLFILIFYLINLYINKKINSTIFITIITILLLYRDILLISSEYLSENFEFFTRINVVDYIFKDIEKKNIYNKIDNYYDHQLEFNSIILENISFKYKKSVKYILNNFNLKIDTNHIIFGITGLSGIGKSTFVKLLIKMYKFEGRILIDGLNLNKLNTLYIRKNIVYINQDSKLFDKKVIDNIFYGCNMEKSNMYLEEIMKFEKIKELFYKIDFNKKILKSGENLSGGQRQVINIINGLITESKILILDEPTNALDKELKKEVIDLIVYFKKYKKCIIIISHDKDIFPYFDENILIGTKDQHIMMEE